MIMINIPEILNGSKERSNQENILFPRTVEKWIEEYKTPKEEYNNQFGWSSFTPKNIPLISSLKSLNKHYSELHQPKLPIFAVLYDSVATAIDIGHIAILHVQQLCDIKEQQKHKKTGKQEYNFIPDAMQLDTTKLKSTSIDFYQKKTIADIIAVMDTSSQRVEKHIDLEKLRTFHKEREQEGLRIKEIIARVEAAARDSATVLKTMEANQATHPRYVASVLETYDRNNIWSSTALEQTIAYCIKGMGTPMPGGFETDPRFKLLIKWIEKMPESPIYTGIKAYNPFKKKLDSVGDIVGGSAGLISELGDHFEALPATHIIVKEVTTYSIYKIATTQATVTDSSLIVKHSKYVVENVTSRLSASGGNIKELFKAIQGRYGIVTSELMEHSITNAYTKTIALANTTDTSYLTNLTASRTNVTSTNIKEITANPMSSAKLATAITSSGISAGAAIFHVLNLEIAITGFSKDSLISSSLNLGSALFGTIGAFIELIASTATVRQKIAQKITGKLAIEAAEKSLLAKASGPIQFIAAAFEAGVHGYDSYKLYNQGDNDAAVWAGMTSLTLGTAGVLGGIGTLVAVGAVSSTIPVAGWIAAAVLFTIAGIATLFMKVNATDRPIEIWLSRTIFGIPRTKFFSGTKADKPYNDFSEVLADYYIIAFSPIKLDDAEKVLSDNAVSEWNEHGFKADEAKFTFLLPAFVSNLSEWSYKLDGYDGGNVKNDQDRDADTITEPDLVLEKKDQHEIKIANEGLYIYVSKFMNLGKTDSAGLEITYWPQGKKGRKIVKTLYVDD